MSKYRKEFEGDDGWSRWILPDRKLYKMSCCDCGLVHDLQLKAVKASRGTRPGYSKITPAAPNHRVLFRARRNRRATAAVRRHKKVAERGSQSRAGITLPDKVVRIRG